MNTYDPVAFWNTREHPNTAENPGLGTIDRDFVEPKLHGARSLLEIGPGVGRLFPLYKGIKKVATLDLSRNYRDRARKAARAAGVDVTDRYLEQPLAKFPYRRDGFDVGIMSHVLMHVPFENVAHTMKEAARCCRKVVATSVSHHSWPRKGIEFDPVWHCFEHDYEEICRENDLELNSYERFYDIPGGYAFGFVFARR